MTIIAIFARYMCDIPAPIEAILAEVPIHITLDVLPISSCNVAVATFASRLGAKVIEALPVGVGPVLPTYSTTVNHCYHSHI